MKNIIEPQGRKCQIVYYKELPDRKLNSYFPIMQCHVTLLQLVLKKTCCTLSVTIEYQTKEKCCHRSNSTSTYQSNEVSLPTRWFYPVQPVGEQ